MEAALVSFNDSAFVNRADGLSKLFFKFDKLAHLATLAIASDGTFAGGKRLDDGLRNLARTTKHRRIPRRRSHGLTGKL